jgi:glycosyltransferase involved in cell wall biosynthesis
MVEDGGHPFLSLVIPAFNEAARLPATLTKINAYLARQLYDAEVLVVDDGSADGTAELVREWARDWPDLRLIATPHGGKGHAVRAGLLAARGTYAFVCDADLSMPISELSRLVPVADAGAEITIASREGPGARRYGEPLYRHLMGRVFNAFVRWAVLPGIQDSQCGFKLLRGEWALALARAQTIDGWGFDVELLGIARRQGARIVEVPVAWYYAPSSRVRPLRDAWHMTREVLAVRRNLRRGDYARVCIPDPAVTPGTRAEAVDARATSERAAAPVAPASAPPLASEP